MDGYIKLHRTLLDNPIINKPDYFTVWCLLLLNANHKENSFIFNNKKMSVKPGQLITGRKKIAEITGIAESQVYKILNYFEKEGQIEQQKNNKFTLISILNWHKYQGNGTTKEQPSNNQVTTTEQPRNTNKNDKNDKKEKNKIYSSDLQAKSEPKIVFNRLTEKWENIQDKHIDAWVKSYPACDIPIELGRMKQWILANGAKGYKSNWYKFIINWLSRTQDRGGSFKN